MQNRISIYLSGSVIKGHKENEENKMLWGDIEIETVRNMFAPIEVDFLNPSERGDDLSNSATIVGRDLMQVYFSDVVLVDAREKRGIGVGAEMAFAVLQNIPVITIAPQNTHYHKEHLHLLGQEIDNWIHPFVEGLSGKVAESLEDAITFIKATVVANLGKTKSPERENPFFKNIKLYLDTQLERDLPMQELFANNAGLQQKKENFLNMMNSSGYKPTKWKKENRQTTVADVSATSSNNLKLT